MAFPDAERKRGTEISIVENGGEAANVGLIPLVTERSYIPGQPPATEIESRAQHSQQEVRHWQQPVIASRRDSGMAPFQTHVGGTRRCVLHWHWKGVDEHTGAVPHLIFHSTATPRQASGIRKEKHTRAHIT
jgi:hypothetical protein